MHPGLIPTALAVYSFFALRRPRKIVRAEKKPVARRRRRIVRVLDVLALVAFVAGVASLLVRDLKIGPLDLRDPGRALVFLTVLIGARFLVALPDRSRFSDLREFLRARRLDRRAALFVVVGLTGLVVALGGYTPYYTFLFQSFGFVFRAIRAPARGMVLLHLALAVLASWGLSLLLRRVRSRTERAGFIAAALVLTAIEYRAAPIDFPAVDRRPAPVYRWLSGVAVGGAVLEWPIGFDWDAEHVFRSTAHWKALINGYSGFAPPHYDELKTLLEERPVPEEAWKRIRALGGALLVFHPHESENLPRLNYARAARKALSEGKLEVLGSFPHGANRDFVFRIAPASPFETRIPADERNRAAADFERLTSLAESELAPPFGVIDFPTEGAEIATGTWGYGWALDDSGIAAVEVATELGPATRGFTGGVRPDIPPLYPGYADAANSGFAFLIPKVPGGPHTISIALIGKDGGRTVLKRRVRIR
jgi:hypothetical protein